MTDVKALAECGSVAHVLNLPFFINGGRITNRQSAIFATAEWANNQERKLLGLHCGQMLGRARHLRWAEDVVSRSQFLMQPGGSFGVVVLPRAELARRQKEAPDAS